VLNIDFEQNLSSPRFSFDTMIGRSNTGVMPALLTKNRKQHSAKGAIILYVQEIKSRRVNLVARSLSALVNVKKIHVHTVRTSRLKKVSVLNEIPRRGDCQNKINVISSYSNLPIIRWEHLKKANCTKRHYVGWKQPLRWRLVWYAKNNFPIKK